jgi:hypothetical protein
MAGANIWGLEIRAGSVFLLFRKRTHMSDALLFQHLNQATETALEKVFARWRCVFVAFSALTGSYDRLAMCFPSLAESEEGRHLLGLKHTDLAETIRDGFMVIFVMGQVS